MRWKGSCTTASYMHDEDGDEEGDQEGDQEGDEDEEPELVNRLTQVKIPSTPFFSHMWRPQSSHMSQIEFL